MKSLQHTHTSPSFWLFTILFFALFSCSKTVDPPTNPLVEAFRAETGIPATWTTDTILLNTVRSFQGFGHYPGTDDWVTANLPTGSLLYGGLPEQSAYYTVEQTLIDADAMRIDVWQRLQVKTHPTYGHKPMMGVFKLKNPTTVAIARSLANLQYGEGGAWQIYIETFVENLTVIDTVTLQ